MTGSNFVSDHPGGVPVRPNPVVRTFMFKQPHIRTHICSCIKGFWCYAAGGDDKVPELSEAASSPVFPPPTAIFPLLLASGEDMSGLTPSFIFLAGLGTFVTFFLGATSTVGPSSSSVF